MSKRIITQTLTPSVRLHRDIGADGKPSLTLEADSLSALVEYTSSEAGKPKGAFANDPSSRSESRKDKTWDLNAGYEGAVEVATNGWADGRKLVEQTLAVLAQSSGQGIPPEDDVAGGVLDVPSFVAGDPCHYDCDPEDASGQARIIRIIIPLSVNWAVEANILVNRGAAIASVVDSLEARGQQVEVIAFSGHGTSRGQANVRFTVKQAGEHLSTDRLAAALCHPATFRRLCFAGVESLGGLTEGKFEVDPIRSGYGSPVTSTTLDFEPAGTIVFPLLHSTREYSTPQAAKATITQVFNAAGLRVDYV
jgi:hypothetical protein